MASPSVELKDLKSLQDSSSAIVLTALDPESPHLLQALSSELSRVQVVSTQTSQVLESYLKSGLKSPDTLHLLLNSSSIYYETVLNNLDALNKILSQSTSLRSSFINSNSSLLKSYITLKLLKTIQNSLAALSSTPSSSLLNSDQESYNTSKSTLNTLILKLESHPLNPLEDYPDFMTVLLSVFSSFIHLTNFYILTLSAKDFSLYVGMDAEYSGLLSAANWASAVVFTFVYSFWSNYQYKLPTFICALFVVIGDFTYLLAYPYKSPALMLAGRLLIGIGGARVINRRYIATYVHPRARTFWNSVFVAGSIIGRGLGPYISTWLLDINISLSFIEINKFTSAPLLMGSVWLVYSILVLIFFKEPEIAPNKQSSAQDDGKSLLPLYVVLLALVVPKMVHEAFVTSVPIVAPDYFDWSDEYIGSYIALMSLGIAPVHIFIAYTSKYIEDRQFIFAALIFTFVGSLLLVDFGIGGGFEVQYVAGTVIMFIGMNMDDGVTASLLSKILPVKMAQGILNAGLIVTFAGSSARGVGGFLIAVVGWVQKGMMENLLFAPLTGVAFVALVVFYLFYSRLRVSH